MKRAILILIGALSYGLVQAQSTDKVYRFDYMEESIDMSLLEPGQSYDHFLGSEVGKKMYLLKESYTWRDEPDPIKPTPTVVIEKPSIYNNIKKLERYYKKSIKKDKLTVEVASAEFVNILDIALQVRYQATEELENHLQKIKEVEEIAAVFSKNVELSYY
ncbi:MAG: hypothetical protein ABJ004_09180 [Cyclobacteriaceae bacterium]